jgi:hypothetical protein
MKKSQKRSVVMTLLFVSLLTLLTGCSSFVADREQGFNMIQRGFSALEPTPGLYKEVELEHVKVVIVGTREQFQWKKAAVRNSQILGYATPANEIWIFGKMVDGKIVVNEAVIGHELTHLLNFKNPEIANPDKFRELRNIHDLNLAKK